MPHHTRCSKWVGHGCRQTSCAVPPNVAGAPTRPEGEGERKGERVKTRRRGERKGKIVKRRRGEGRGKSLRGGGMRERGKSLRGGGVRERGKSLRGGEVRERGRLLRGGGGRVETESHVNMLYVCITKVDLHV